MTDDIVTRLRGIDCNRGDVHDAADEIERLRQERDSAMIRVQGILAEIDCRIEHGADSNGHLEGIRNLFKENTNDTN